MLTFPDFPDFLAWLDAFAARFGLSVLPMSNSAIVLAGRAYGLLFSLDPDGASLSFLEAVPNTRIDEYDLGRYLVLHRPRPEAFTPKSEDTPQRTHAQRVAGELRMFRVLLEAADDIARGAKQWIPESKARPLPMSEDRQSALRVLLNR